MSQVDESPKKRLLHKESEALREEVLRVLEDSLEEARAQRPLEIPRVFEYDRPTLGDSVPIELYRAVRLIAFREALGFRISAPILYSSGRSVSRKMGITGIESLVGALRDFRIVNPRIEAASGDLVVISATECATCSGIPNVGEPVCHFESGFISGGLEGVLGDSPDVTETRCWGLGDKECTWEARSSFGDGNGAEDPLSVALQVAGRAAAAVDSAAAICEQNRELRAACDRLKESELLREDLIDMIVHDMRTPLNAVLGCMEVLSEPAASDRTPERAELMSLAVSSGQSLLRMVDHLLDISRIEQRQFTLRKQLSPVAVLIDEAVRQIRVTTKRRKQELAASVTPGVPDVFVDADRVTRVLVNLMSNAVKCTPSGGRIVVRADVDAPRTNVVFSVEDNGIGIPEEYHERIFDKFFQAEAYKSRNAVSSGIGLAFCKLVTEAHGGSIWVESQPGVGSTFRFTIPARSPDAD